MFESEPISYFLGANTSQGFVSFYGDVADVLDGDFIWYIKGGPGNGKSSFMRAVASAAESAGSAVEYIRCSGDPESLDGIYIRDLHMAYVDATSPHVQEPALPGASGKYIDLSVFYKKNAVYDRSEISRLFASYRAQYSRAYDLFRAASLCQADSIPGLITSFETDSLRKQGREFAEEILPAGDGYTEKHRFLRANTCLGEIYFPSILTYYKTVYKLRSAFLLYDPFLQGVREVCRERGSTVILIPDPLRPAILEGILIPEAGIALTCCSTKGKGVAVKGETIDLDARLSREQLLIFRDDIRDSRASFRSLIRQGTAALARAKLFHDELESLYHPTVNFSALDRFTKKHIAEHIRN